VSDSISRGLLGYLGAFHWPWAQTIWW